MEYAHDAALGLDEPLLPWRQRDRSAGVGAISRVRCGGDALELTLRRCFRRRSLGFGTVQSHEELDLGGTFVTNGGA